MSLLELLSRPAFLAPLVVFVAYSLFQRLTVYRNIPKGIPWASQDERIQKIKQPAERLTTLKKLYSDHGLKFVYKAFLQDATVVLPASDVSWIISQPSTVLSNLEAHREALQTDWTFLDQTIVKNPIHEQVIRDNMVRKLDTFTDAVMDELRQCFEDYWGNSTEWHEVNVWDSMLHFFSRTSNRMFVGLPLCQNETYLSACRSFSTDIIFSSVILRLIPKFIRPVLGYFAVIPNWLHSRSALKFLVPLIEERQEIIRRNPDKKPADILPNDFLTWAVTSPHATAAEEVVPSKIARRTMAVNFAAIHTTTMTTTNLILDLFSAPKSTGFVEALQEEVAQVHASFGGAYPKAALAAMTRTDSALRESMRLNGFVVWGMERRVVAKQGVRMPDGTLLRYWTKIAVPAWGVHHDEELYSSPNEYDALRFSRVRDSLDASDADKTVKVGEEGLVEGELGGGGEADGKKTTTTTTTTEKGGPDLGKVLESKNLSTVTTGNTFMQFGHGKHSCPGRFFAVQEIKLLMAFMLQNYEIKQLDNPPPDKWLGGEMRVPPTKANIMVRRKVGSL